jgi:hypothetical protein
VKHVAGLHDCCILPRQSRRRDFASPLNKLNLARVRLRYGVQHQRCPFGSIVHDLPVREFTTTVEPAYGAGT